MYIQVSVTSTHNSAYTFQQHTGMMDVIVCYCWQWMCVLYIALRIWLVRQPKYSILSKYIPTPNSCLHVLCCKCELCCCKVSSTTVYNPITEISLQVTKALRSYNTWYQWYHTVCLNNLIPCHCIASWGTMPQQDVVLGQSEWHCLTPTYVVLLN